MLTLDELKKLQEANKLLNLRYKELGLKPIDFSLSDSSVEDYLANTSFNRAEQLESASIQNAKTYLQNTKSETLPLEISEPIEEIEETSLETVEAIKEPEQNTNFESFEDLETEILAEETPKSEPSGETRTAAKKFFLVIIALVFVFIIINIGPKDSSKEKKKMKISFAKNEKVEKKGPLKIISVNNPTKTKPYIITSGVYTSKDLAKEAKRLLADVTDVPLKIKQLDSYFTVQIGSAYKDFDNAVIVYRELSKYSIKDLAIKQK